MLLSSAYGQAAAQEGVQIVKSNDTAISSLKTQTATEGRYYNISGVRVAAPAKKGIYIHNGRKFVVK